jgi:hypothetical protein
MSTTRRENEMAKESGGTKLWAVINRDGRLVDIVLRGNRAESIMYVNADAGEKLVRVLVTIVKK